MPSLTAARLAGRWSERAAWVWSSRRSGAGFLLLSGLTHSFVCLAGVFFVDAVALGRWDRLGSIAAAERWLADLGLCWPEIRRLMTVQSSSHAGSMDVCFHAR
jgi:hypothetical protein